MEKRLNEELSRLFNKDIRSASEKEIYSALLKITKDEMAGRERIGGKKKLYYISAEFLIGKLLSNNLINLGMFKEVKEALERNGKDLYRIEEEEFEPSLGNGGLGRLAACFLDSVSSLNLPGDGIGLNYHFGLFEQKFENNLQKEVKNPWLTDESECWLTKDKNAEFSVPFRRFTVKGKLYDIDVPGYDVKGVNKLHLFDLDTIDESLVSDSSIDFNKEEIEKNLTLFLYPDDSDDKGRLLRIYQQYFMVSCGAQLILKETKERGGDLRRLNEYVTIQINDTHPSMVIPELIRLLLNEGFTMDEAISIVRKTCAYTNHTILSEALEKWPMSYMEDVVPHLLPIIRELDNRVRKEFSDKTTYIIDDENRVHMAHMDIHYGYSINGVAALHTEILKNSELNNFYKIYPGKFNNKTNGITFRRWLLHCNEPLTDLITEKIGEGFKKNVNELSKLMDFKDDPDTLFRLQEIKKRKKQELSDFFKETQNLSIDPNSIFDVQVKRLHEYKRQQMNCLYAIYKIKEIRKGNLPKTPITMIFGAKAAPAYTIAKDIIHLILCLQELTKNDLAISPYFRVVMTENYNVTKAAKIIPAAEISEQISLASKEASGTSNMKFMLNGAVTLGTEDGANVEIKDLVGDENIYIFGEKSDKVIELYDTSGYVSREFYDKDYEIKDLLDFILSDEVLRFGSEENLKRLYNEILNKDYFMTLLDIKDYIKVKEKMLLDYEDKNAWNKKALINISKAGFFSSDRTIAEYNSDIWHLG